MDEPELHLGTEPDIAVPDLAGWRRERIPREAAFITLAPDGVCEVLSPSTQAVDRSDKMDLFRREGARHLWHVEPAGETDAVELALGALWAE